MFRFCVFLQIRFAVEGCREGHVVQGSRGSIHSLVRLHALDAILGLVRRQFPTQFVRQDVRLVTGQDAERINHLRRIKECLKRIRLS